jgi:hypothetical protein
MITLARKALLGSKKKKNKQTNKTNKKTRLTDPR